ncbi:VCBS repeat-containing protein [Pendulispora brunnea]|uniref:VCBS repeat-containing protein n=1 Tax=Pendulispora brunnea TaxID=2905690 RepID=A0ABZ2KH94_9BACT
MKPVVRFLTLGLFAASLIPACAPAVDEEETSEETSQPISVSEIMARAHEWVDKAVPYCGGVRGGRDVLCGGTCNRPPAPWDAYRSDCSGYVAWSWQLGADLTTATFVNDRGGANGWTTISIDNLQAGDALVTNGHIKLFSHFVASNTMDILEEYDCDRVAREAVQSFTRSGNTVKFAGDGRVYHAIRRNGVVNPPPVHRASSLSGEGRAEIIAVQQNGEVEAWYNYAGFAHMPWSSSTIVGRGFNDPARVRFADIDGDGKLEIIAIQENGAVQAWHNDRGFTEMPWGESIIIAEGFNDPARVRFADLDGDRRAEIIAIQTNGEIQAWHNGRGFVYMPWDADHIIGQGFNEPARVRLADLDGDGRAELMAIQTNGNIQAWHNGAGFAHMPWDADVVIGEGFNDPARVRLADLDADGRAELMIIRENGQVQAWHNGRGFVYMPWDADVIIAEGFDPARTLLQ